MSGTGTPFDRFTGGNAIMPPRQVAQPPAAAQPQPQPTHHIPMHVTRNAHANVDQATMIKRRDAMPDVMNELSSIVNSKDDANRADIVAYIGGMVGKGIIAPEEATQLLQMLPEDQAGMRQWARVMFSAAMNVGVHAHAAYPKEIFPAEGEEPAQGTANE